MKRILDGDRVNLIGKKIKEIREENLDILYPHGLSHDFYVKKISAISEDPPKYCMHFSDNASTIVVCVDGVAASDLSKDAEVYETENGIVSYLTDDGSVFSAVVINSGWTYYVTTYDRTQLITVLNSLY